MNEIQRKEFPRCSKKELLYIIEEYDNIINKVSALLVRESSKELDPDKTCELIREYITKTNRFKNPHIKEWCQLQLGEITPGEYHNKVLS